MSRKRSSFYFFGFFYHLFWLSQGHHWAAKKEMATLIQYWLRRIIQFNLKVIDSLLMRLGHKTQLWVFSRHFSLPLFGVKNSIFNWISRLFLSFSPFTAQKMKFSIEDFFSKCDQIRRKLWIWSHILKKSLMENFIFCAVIFLQ